MAQEVLVINEWLLHDLGGRNGSASREQALGFLQSLPARQDRIAIAQATPWVNKAYQLMKSTDPASRFVSKLLHSILLDPDVCIMLPCANSDVIPLPIREITPPDDLYLVAIYFASHASALVTTDQRLIDTLSIHQEVVLQSRDAFLQRYLV